MTTAPSSTTTYAIRDAGLASFLRLRQHTLLAIDRDYANRPVFVFADGPGRAEDVILYTDGGATTISPKELMTGFRALQSAAATTPRRQSRS